MATCKLLPLTLVVASIMACGTDQGYVDKTLTFLSSSSILVGPDANGLLYTADINQPSRLKPSEYSGSRPSALEGVVLYVSDRSDGSKLAGNENARNILANYGSSGGADRSPSILTKDSAAYVRGLGTREGSFGGSTSKSYRLILLEAHQQPKILLDDFSVLWLSPGCANGGELYCIGRDQDDEREFIYAVNTGTGESHKVVTKDAPSTLAVLPNKPFLAYSVSNENKESIMVMDIQSGKSRNVGTIDAYVSQMCFSLDGSSLLAMADKNRDGNYVMWKFNMKAQRWSHSEKMNL